MTNRDQKASGPAADDDHCLDRLDPDATAESALLIDRSFYEFLKAHRVGETPNLQPLQLGERFSHLISEVVILHMPDTVYDPHYHITIRAHSHACPRYRLRDGSEIEGGLLEIWCMPHGLFVPFTAHLTGPDNRASGEIIHLEPLAESSAANISDMIIESLLASSQGEAGVYGTET